jgi:hypothetical protein
MKNVMNKNKTQKLTTFMRTIKNCFPGHMRPAGRGLPTPDIYNRLFMIFVFLEKNMYEAQG